MCIHPRLIKNPNYGAKGYLSKVKDTQSQYIRVPCGYCLECIRSRQSQVMQRALMMCFDYHPFFITLTYNPDSLPIWTFSNGRQVPFADIRDPQLMFKRIRKENLIERPIKWILCSELGTKKGRPHFHCLLFVRKLPCDDYNTCVTLESRLFKLILSQWKRNYGTSLAPDWRPLCTYVRKYFHGELKYNFDLVYVFRNSTRSIKDVSFYVTKYLLKPSDRAIKLQRALRLNLSEEEYNSSWNHIKPRCSWSKDFGLPKSPRVRKYLERCISQSLVSGSEFPQFFCDDGKSFPLARYYRSKGAIFPVETAMAFFERHLAAHPGAVDGTIDPDPRDLSELSRLYDHQYMVGLFDSRRDDPMDFDYDGEKDVEIFG